MDKYLKEICKKKPWIKHYWLIKSRCNSDKNSYYFKKGIKNFLTILNLKRLWFRDKAYLLKKPSIDRLDFRGNYTLDNCRFIEKRFNSAIKKTNKLNFSIAQQIRKQLMEGKNTVQLGKEYKVSRNFIGQIGQNKWYKPETYGGSL